MGNNVLVSIVMATYNRAAYISKAIESVFSQTFKDFEFIIVNDGSTDETSKILSELQKEYSVVKIINNDSNIDISKSLNKGIRAANGKYIARIDDDDFWLNPKKLEKQIHFLENNPEHVIVGGGVVRVDASGKEILHVLLSEKDEDIRKAILQNNPFAHSNTVFRKEAWNKVGGYDEKLNFSEDWDLWMRLAAIGKLYNFQEYFLKYLKAGQNKMNDSTSVTRENAKINIKLRWKHRKEFPGFIRAYCFGIAHYLYSFIPYRSFFHVFFSALRRRFFGQPAYTFYEKK